MVCIVDATGLKSCCVSQKHSWTASSLTASGMVAMKAAHAPTHAMQPTSTPDTKARTGRELLEESLTLFLANLPCSVLGAELVVSAIGSRTSGSDVSGATISSRGCASGNADSCVSWEALVFGISRWSLGSSVIPKDTISSAFLLRPRDTDCLDVPESLTMSEIGSFEVLLSFFSGTGML